MTRVAYIECSGEIWRKIARRARDQHGWQPVYWSGAAQDILAIEKEHPDVITHNGVLAAKGVAPNAAAELSAPPLDAQLLDALAPHESMSLHMMDRMDIGGSFSHEERRRHYYDLLRMWLGLYTTFRPDVAVFSIAPHIVYDYVAYALARHLSIPTLMFERLGLPGYVYPLRTIHEDAVQRGDGNGTPGPEFMQFFQKNQAGGVSAIPANFERKLARFGVSGDGRSSIWSTLAQEAKRSAYLVKRHGLGPVDKNYQKLPGQRPAASAATAMDVMRARVGAAQRKRKLRTHLDQLASAPEGDRPFVFLALHYQPERATVPMGGALADQTLVVDLLAKTLPPEMLLYVKEHPWQLQPASRPEIQRSTDFYDTLVQYKNVRLMKADADTSQLIDKATAVATSTGSAGWQAICRGKPALVFGAAWYKNCPGAYPIHSQDDAKAAFAAITSGARPKADEILKFLASVEKVCVRGVLEPDVEQVKDLDYDAAAIGMADALAGLLGKR